MKKSMTLTVAVDTRLALNISETDDLLGVLYTVVFRVLEYIKKTKLYKKQKIPQCERVVLGKRLVGKNLNDFFAMPCCHMIG